MIATLSDLAPLLGLALVIAAASALLWLIETLLVLPSALRARRAKRNRARAEARLACAQAELAALTRKDFR